MKTALIVSSGYMAIHQLSGSETVSFRAVIIAFLILLLLIVIAFVVLAIIAGKSASIMEGLMEETHEEL